MRSQSLSIISSITFAASSLAPNATAQCPASLSFLAGAPSGISLSEDPAAPFSSAVPYYQRTGFRRSPPVAWPTAPNGLHFRLDQVWTSCGANQAPDIDALSLGQDWLLIDDATGEVEVPFNRWAVLQISVERSAQGQVGSVIATEAADPEGPGADIFTHVFAGSTLPADLLGKTFRSHDSNEIDVGPGRREIDALDHFMPLYLADPSIRAMLPQSPSVYFSVSSSTLGLVPAQAWAGTIPSGATIFRCDWLPTAARWSCPRVWKLYSQLGLQASEDLDALAYDEENERLLFSTKTRSRNEILFVFCGRGSPAPSGEDGGVPMPMPLKEDGINVSDKIGLLIDDGVDSLCGIDPSVRGRSNGINPWFYSAGTPLPTLLPPTDTVGASAFRVPTATGPAILTTLVGWPELTGVGDGIALLVLSPVGSSDQLALFGGFRDTTPLFCGDPQTYQLDIPPALWLVPSSFDFELHWYLADRNLTEIQDAHPLLMRL